MNKENYIAEALSGHGIHVNMEQALRFSKYYDLLIDWNSRMNLTAVTEFEAVVERHFMDSLAPAWSTEKGASIDITEAKALLDVGSGAGFPGIPLAIMFPDTEVILLDSLNKRSEFQRTVKETLNINNLSIINGRAEDVSRETAQRETYDIVVSRAVAELSVLCELSLPFVKIGGAFIAYKGVGVQAELSQAQTALEELGGIETSVIPYQTGEDSLTRSLVLISKKARTPEKYPRRAGIPSKRPL